MDLLDEHAATDHVLQCIRWCLNHNHLDALNQHLKLHVDRLVNQEEDIASLLFDAVEARTYDGFRTLLLYLDDTVMARKKTENGRTLVDQLMCQTLKTHPIDMEILEKLFQRGADENLCYHGAPILHSAVLSGNLDVAETLLNHGADIKTKNRRGDNLLHALIVCPYEDDKKVDKIQWLINKGVDIHEKSSSGKSPLHIAAAHTPQVVTFLLQQGCDVNIEDDVNYDTPLHVACAFCRYDVIPELLRHGAKTNKLNKQGQTPLEKLLHFSLCHNDFHSKTRRCVARNLIQIGFKIPSPSRENVQRKGRNRENIQRKGRNKVYEMYLSILASNKNVQSLQSISRSTIMNNILPGVKVREFVLDLDIPETLKHYLLFKHMIPLEDS